MDLAAKRSKSWPLGRPQEKLKNDWFKTLPDREHLGCTGLFLLLLLLLLYYFSTI